jgi:predicted metalloprotease with PDZ domain
MKDLSKSYGKDKSFKDEELFNKIVALTYPEIGTFFKRYVAGKEPLPIKESLALAGIDVGSGDDTKKEITFGGVAIGYNQISEHVQIVSTSAIDDFGKAMGYEEGDELIKFNGKKITLENSHELIGNYLKNAKSGDLLKVTVKRKQLKSGKMKKVKLKSPVFATSSKRPPEPLLMTAPTPKQLKIREAWIGKHEN